MDRLGFNKPDMSDLAPRVNVNNKVSLPEMDIESKISADMFGYRVFALVLKGDGKDYLRVRVAKDLDGAFLNALGELDRSTVNLHLWASIPLEDVLDEIKRLT